EGGDGSLALLPKPILLSLSLLSRIPGTLSGMTARRPNQMRGREAKFRQIRRFRAETDWRKIQERLK
ncbi:hypothetical protein, partial [Paracoccus sp. MKU1]|uniref:hypothetical protein n=1 Tax=Paracoccus sp. MKU1 TaxID=1745182 RepID=UPI00193DB989